MRVRYFLTTVGEMITAATLASLKDFAPQPMELTIWYDTRGGEVDVGFLTMLHHYTKDVIVLGQQHGLTAACGFALLYLPYDYLVLVAADTPVFENFLPKLLKPFRQHRSIAAVGEGWRELAAPYVISDFDVGIDGVVAIARRAVNDAGGFSPSFNGRGPHHTELYRRFARNGWDYAVVSGVCYHAGKQHEGRDSWMSWEKELHADNLTYLDLDRRGYRGYRWWANDLNKMLEEAPAAETSDSGLEVAHG